MGDDCMLRCPGALQLEEEAHHRRDGAVHLPLCADSVILHPVALFETGGCGFRLHGFHHLDDPVAERHTETPANWHPLRHWCSIIVPWMTLPWTPSCSGSFGEAQFRAGWDRNLSTSAALQDMPNCLAQPVVCKLLPNRLQSSLPADPFKAMMLAVLWARSWQQK